jgi:hypothetical protein
MAAAPIPRQSRHLLAQVVGVHVGISLSGGDAGVATRSGVHPDAEALLMQLG